MYKQFSEGEVYNPFSEENKANATFDTDIKHNEYLLSTFTMSRTGPQEKAKTTHPLDMYKYMWEPAMKSSNLIRQDILIP